VANSLGEKKIQRSAFGFRRSARALAAGLPRQNHVYITTDESFLFTTKNSIKYVVNWIPLRFRVRSRNTQPHLKSIKDLMKRNKTDVKFASQDLLKIP